MGARDERVQLVRRDDAVGSPSASRPARPRRRSRRSAERARRARCAARPSARSAPSCMRRATTAHSSRSPRNLGKMRPRLTSSTPCPARPMRCRPRATDFGDSICSTRSTAPMSMPSSSELVATRHGSSPAFSSSSTFVRSSRASEPWCARAISAARGPSGAGASAPRARQRRRRRIIILLSACLPASSFRRSATRSAERRLLTNTIVELCALHERQQLGVDRRPDRAARRLAAGDRLQRIVARGSTGPPGSVIDSTGTSMRRSSCLRAPASTIVTSRRGPTR